MSEFEKKIFLLSTIVIQRLQDNVIHYKDNIIYCYAIILLYNQIITLTIIKDTLKNYLLLI